MINVPPRPQLPKDLLGRLPAAAAAKLQKLDDAAHEAAVLRLAADTAADDAMQAHEIAKARLADFERKNDWSDRKLMEQTIAGMKAEVAETREQHEHRSQLADDRRMRVTAAVELRGGLLRYVRSLPAGGIANAVATAKVQLGKGETPGDAVRRIRERVAELRADEHAACSAPIPSAEAKRLAREQIGALAAAAVPDVSRLVEAGGTIVWPQRSLDAGTPVAIGVACRKMPDAFGLMCWAQKAALIAAIDAEIDAIANDAEALSASARAKRLADLAAEILDLERQEEALIEAAALAGMDITRRGDADPRAVLGIA